MREELEQRWVDAASRMQVIASMISLCSKRHLPKHCLHLDAVLRGSEQDSSVNVM